MGSFVTGLLIKLDATTARSTAINITRVILKYCVAFLKGRLVFNRKKKVVTMIARINGSKTEYFEINEL
jgi:hypothetical protein